MPRKRKQDIKINNTASLEGLMQEIYNDACLQVLSTQSTINELSVSAIGKDVDDFTKIAKEKGGLLKVKESGIRLKLEVAKLQSDIIKHGGDADAAVNERSNGSASMSDFKTIRQMIKDNKDNEEIDNDE